MLSFIDQVSFFSLFAKNGKLAIESMVRQSKGDVETLVGTTKINHSIGHSLI